MNKMKHIGIWSDQLPEAWLGHIEQMHEWALQAPRQVGNTRCAIGSGAHTVVVGATPEAVRLKHDHKIRAVPASQANEKMIGNTGPIVVDVSAAAFIVYDMRRYARKLHEAWKAEHLRVQDHENEKRNALLRENNALRAKIKDLESKT